MALFALAAGRGGEPLVVGRPASHTGPIVPDCDRDGSVERPDAQEGPGRKAEGRMLVARDLWLQ